MLARALRLLLVVLGVAGTNTAMACSCASGADYEGQFLADIFARAEIIVHARIVELDSPYEARIEIAESFKGRPVKLVANSAPSNICGTRFQLGEEAVFFVYHGLVSYCGRLPVTSELLQRLRAYGK